MPSSSEILSGLQQIAFNYKLYAIIWHILYYAFLIAIIAKWRPSNRLVATLISLPFYSVSIFALQSGNPFNGFIFLMSGALLFYFGLKAPKGPISFGEPSCIFIGSIFLTFGLIYPHFVLTDSIFTYLYASPLGLIPCPTISTLVGMMFIFNRFRSRAILLTVTIMGLFYGFFGIFRLGVYIDTFLAVGSVLLLARYIWARISVREI